MRTRPWWRRLFYYDQRPKKSFLYGLIDALPDFEAGDSDGVAAQVDGIMARLDDVHTRYKAPREQVRNFMILQLEHNNRGGARLIIEQSVADEAPNPYAFAAIALAGVMVLWMLGRW